LYEPPLEGVAPITGYNWSGFYAGVIGGWNRSEADGAWNFSGQLTDPPPNLLSFDAHGGTQFRSSGDGGLIGGTVGANLQKGIFVFGLEGDFAWTDKSGKGSDGFTDFVSLTFAEGPPVELELPGKSTHHWDIEWFGTGRLRAGITPFDRLLIFGTGGIAFAGVDLKTTGLVFVAPNFTQMIPPTSSSDTYVGWTAGAGGEFALTPRIRVKADWLYYDLGSESHRSKSVIPQEQAGAPSDVLATQRTKIDLTGNTVRGGVIIAF
jgi:outer membrane immunogenic protein